MEKSISYLKSRAWYRLLKVVYFFCFLVILSGYNLFVFSVIGLSSIDIYKTTIQCNYRDKKVLTVKDANLNLDNQDFKDQKFDYKYFFSNYNEYKIKQILEYCYGDSGVKMEDNIYNQQKIYEIINKYGLIGKEKTQDDINKIDSDYRDYQEKTKSVYKGVYFDNEEAKYLNFDTRAFDIKPVYTYDKFIKLFLIGNISALLFFEIIRRVLYYVILGTFKPES